MYISISFASCNIVLHEGLGMILPLRDETRSDQCMRKINLANEVHTKERKKGVMGDQQQVVYGEVR